MGASISRSARRGWRLKRRSRGRPMPNEIVDHILSMLHSDKDYDSLKSCSVVFPLLVDRYLYSQITFYISGGTVVHSYSTFHMDDAYVVNASDFSRTLLDYPHLSSCVRRVRIVLVAFRSLDPQHFQDISAILPILTHIESLTLTAIGRRTRLPWFRLDPEFSAAFQNSLRLPSIKIVALSNLDYFPLSIFEDCKTLTDLHLHDLGFVGGGDISTYPRLSSLHVDSLSEWTGVITWAKSSLHTLSLCADHVFNFPGFPILIATCSDSLVNLELCQNCFDHSTDLDHPQLRLPLLQHVTFRCSINVESVPGADFSCLNLLIPFLTTITSLSSTSPIRLTLHIGFLFRFTSIPTPDWSEITNILILPIFRHPVELHTSLLLCWCKPKVAALLFNSLDQHLKELMMDGRLVVIKEEGRRGFCIRMNYPNEDPYIPGAPWTAEISSA